MKVHRVVLYVIDFDQLGADGVKDEIESTRFANDCISPKIGEIQTRDIGEWSDEHPLNKRSTADKAWIALFANDSKKKSGAKK